MTPITAKLTILVVLIKIITTHCQEIDLSIEDQRDQIAKELEDLVEETINLNNKSENHEEELITTTENTHLDDKFDDLGADEDASKEINDTTTYTTAVDSSVDVTNNINNDTESDAADNEVMMETTPMTSTKAMEVEVDSGEDIEVTGQRNPKTENTDQEDADPRSFDTKPPPSTPVSRSSTLKAWLEDSWLRPPAGILVPLRPMALNRALAVWKDLNAEGLNVTDIIIVGFDSNGVNWRSRHNLQPSKSAKVHDVPETLSKLLLKYQGVRSDSSTDGTMRALTTAAKLVPYDSALFVITDKGASDPQRLPLALRALVEKRLKVYTVWTDPDHPSVESESSLQELRNISRHTEGDVLPYAMQVMDIESPKSDLSPNVDLQNWQPMELKQQRRGRVNNEHDFERFDTLLVRRGGGEAISLGLPVESGVTALKILIEGAVEHAVFYPPNEGPQIDLYNETSIGTFSPRSRTEGQSPREVYLVFPGAPDTVDSLKVMPATTTDSELETVMAGVWHLSVRCDTCDYRLCVSARSYIHLDVEPDTSGMLRIRVTGPVASVRESLLVDEYGHEMAKLSFSYQPMAGEGQDVQVDPVAELVADVAMPKHEEKKFYVKIVGRDVKGEPFVRLSGPLGHTETRQSRSASISFPDAIDDLEAIEEENSMIYSQIRFNDSSISPTGRAISQITNQQGLILTAVQIGLSSKLYGTPGENLQLHFEVSNFRDQAVRFNFKAEGEQRFLTGISPTSQLIQPGQTVNVIVSLRIRTAAQPGTRDIITFTAYGTALDEVSISAYIYVVNTVDRQIDVWRPELRHSFQGSCIGRMGDDCAIHMWSATVIARDALGGLLRLSSSPQGIMYSSNYISGTRDEVIATYRSTCCTPRVMVTAVDTYGNVNSYVVDISYYLTDAAIAAIVLGVLLLIAIILLTIYLIIFCVRRRKESRELPYSTSSRNIS